MVRGIIYGQREMYVGRGNNMLTGGIICVQGELYVGRLNSIWVG